MDRKKLILLDKISMVELNAWLKKFLKTHWFENILLICYVLSL